MRNTTANKMCATSVGAIKAIMLCPVQQLNAKLIVK